MPNKDPSRRPPRDFKRLAACKTLGIPKKLKAPPDDSSYPILCVLPLFDGASSPRTGGSASEDKTLKVWDVATGECVATLEGHSESVRAASTVLL